MKALAAFVLICVGLGCVTDEYEQSPDKTLEKGIGQATQDDSGHFSAELLNYGVTPAGCRVVGTAPFCEGSCGDCNPEEFCVGPFDCDPKTGNCCWFGSKYLCCS